MAGLDSRRRTVGLVGAVLAVLVVASPVFGQAIVQGTIVGPDGQPVVGATVTIVSDENNRTFELETDDKGEYFQIGLPPGPYTVTATLDNLQASGPVNASTQRPTRVDLTMQSTQSVDEEVANALRALIAEANAASQAGDHQTALAKFTELAAGVPACADCYDNIGREYLAMNNLDEAEAAFKQAIVFDPNHPNAYNGLANLYNAQKKFDLAAEASAKAAEIGGAAGGASADSLYNQGVVAWNAGKAEEARGHFEAAIAANPKHGPSHFQLGMALVNAGSLPEAKAEFEMYLEIAPQGAFADQATAMIAAIP